MKAWLAPALTLIVPAACTIVFVLAGPSGTRAGSAPKASSSAVEAPQESAPLAANTSASAEARPSAAPPAATAEERLRERIRVAYETQGADVQTPRDLDRYLDTLEQQARAQGAVTAVQVEPGFRAIRQAPFTQDPAERMQKLTAFSDRMAKLSASLAGTSDAPAAPPALDDIKRASGSDRAQLIEKYLDATRRLPPDQRTEANQQLNELVQNN